MIQNIRDIQNEWYPRNGKLSPHKHPPMSFKNIQLYEFFSSISLVFLAVLEETMDAIMFWQNSSTIVKLQ